MEIWEVKIKIKLEEETDRFGAEDTITDALNAADIPFFSIDWRQIE